MAHLTLLLDGREVRKFLLNRGVTSIGRGQDNDIVINNLALSRRHAQVELKGGRYEVVDLQSQNGVFVNQERVRQPRELQDRDAITLGTYQFVFRTEDGELAKNPPGQKRNGELTLPEDLDPASDESSAVVPLLVLKYNDVELQRFPLRGELCLIGRAKECDVQVAERRLSRKHCQIERVRDRYVLRDLGSQNGTYVNRRRIKDTYDLKQGDVLNFAEYTVLFLADVGSYAGPDSPRAEPTSSAGLDPHIDKADTIMPPSRDDEDSDAPVRPSELSDDPDAEEAPQPPVSKRRSVESPPPDATPKRRPQAQQQPRAIREKQPPLKAVVDGKRKAHAPEGFGEPLTPRPKGLRPTPAQVQAPASRKSASPAPLDDMGDVPDEISGPSRDDGLDDWYESRKEASEIAEVDPALSEGNEEESVLLPRQRSSVSQVLSTMMVDKGELDQNLRGEKARQRRFFVEVRHHDRVLYTGALSQPVTILGTDRDSDIKLKGRYVAGRHSLLVHVRDSLLLVRLGSSSAARVNGLPKLQAFLKSGDVIQIDETTIRISED